MPGTLVLALDASTETCSVALVAGHAEGFRAEASRAIAGGREPTRRLLAFAGEVLQEVSAGPEDLGAIVVGTGPGTFTGVRIAVATARGLALSLEIPVLGVSTLAALAADAVATATGLDLLAAVVDAHRGQLFGAVYQRVEGLWRQCGGVFAAYPDGLADEIVRRAGGGKALVVGKTETIAARPAAGAESHVDLALCPLQVRAAYLLQNQELFADRVGVSPADTVKAWLDGGHGSPQTLLTAPGGPGSPESVVPIYVRPPDADLHITKMRDPWA